MAKDVVNVPLGLQGWLKIHTLPHKIEFEKAMTQEMSMLYRVASRMARPGDDPGDLVQMTMMRAHKGWNRFDGANIKGWLLKILVNVCRSRAELRAQPEQLSEYESECICDSSLWDRVIQREEISMILRSIEQLPVGQRVVIQLCDVEGSTYEEVADILEIPIGTVRSRLFRARMAVRQMISNEEVQS